jgi:hypothetical protein
MPSACDAMAFRRRNVAARLRASAHADDLRMLEHVIRSWESFTTRTVPLVAGVVLVGCYHASQPRIVRPYREGLVRALGADSACGASRFVRAVSEPVQPGYLPSKPAAYVVRRLDTGAECTLPREVMPVAYVVNGRLFCPDSNPATWTVGRRLPGVSVDEIWVYRLEEDTLVLRQLHCPVTPVVALHVRVAGHSRWEP